MVVLLGEDFYCARFSLNVQVFKDMVENSANVLGNKLLFSEAVDVVSPSL